MGTQTTNGERFRFGVFELDLRTGELRKNGTVTNLPHQPCKILTLLVSNPGELVTREEIKEQIWGNDTFVDFENGLNSAIKRIRTVLGDDAESPRYIETLPRRGYRFIAPLEKVNGAPPAVNALIPTGIISEPSVNYGNAESLPIAMSPPALAMPRIDSGVAARPEPAQAKSRALWRWALVAAVFVIVVGAFAILLRPALPPPKILGYRQLTHDGYPKWVVLATDGTRVYFSQNSPSEVDFSLAYVSAAGGETVPIPTPFRIALLEDISPDGSELLVTDRTFMFGPEYPIYIVTAVGGSTRRVGNVMGHCGGWLADGRIIFENGNDLYLVNRDGSKPHKVVTTPSSAWWPRSSPDGKLIRFSSGGGIWEVGADGTNLHPLLPGWNKPPSEGSGSWTPDGKYFFFLSGKGGTDNIWAIQEGGSALYKVNHEPVQVITGPVSAYSPLPSHDGKKLFVISSQDRGRLVRYDAKSNEFVPYLNGISATSVDFSKDGKWMTYVQVPDYTLWRSKVDGSDKVQLTFPPISTINPRWSPDGTQIAFDGNTPDHGSQAYIIAADGTGTPQMIPVVPGEAGEGDPGWSPDGNSLVYSGVNPIFMGKSGPNAIHLMDTRTRKVTTLPRSDGLFSTRWSPNGRYIAAFTNDSRHLRVYDLSARKWTDLGVNLSSIGYNQWTRDSRVIYFEGVPKGKPSGIFIFRVRLSDHRMEQVASLEHLRITGSFWMGLAPDNSPLLVENIGTQDIYAFDVKLP